MFALFGALPTIFLLLLLWAAAKGQWRAVLLGIAMCVASLRVVTWANVWTGDDHDWGWFFLIPDLAALPGLLALAGAAAWTSHRPRVRLLGMLALLASLAMPAAYAMNKWHRKGAIEVAISEANAPWRALQGKRATVATMPALGLEEMIRRRRDDREFLFEALKRQDLSPELLDELLDERSLGRDSDLTFAVVRHPRTGSATLARVYARAEHPEYFYSSLAAHPHTPPEILRAIRRDTTVHVERLDDDFARNPAAPREILDAISRTTTSREAGRNLLANPALDCRLARQLAASPAADSGYGHDLVRDSARARASRLCK